MLGRMPKARCECMSIVIEIGRRVLHRQATFDRFAEWVSGNRHADSFAHDPIQWNPPFPRHCAARMAEYTNRRTATVAACGFVPAL